MKCAIYGAGSLGLVFAAYLTNKGEKIDVIDRNIKSVEAINNNGILIKGTVSLNEKVNAYLDSEVEEKYDIIFLFTKQLDNQNQIRKVATFLNENGVICSMQNGLPEEDVKAIIGSERTYGCAVGWGATRLSYGISELTSENNKENLSFSLGSYAKERNEYFKEISRLLNIMGSVSEEENFIGARYSKLLINCSFSGMSAVLGTTFGEAAKDKKSRKVIQAIIKECIDLANHLNIKIEKIQGKDVVKLVYYKTRFKKFISFLIIPLAIKKHRNLKASMLQDLEKHIPCEIDSINGIIKRLGDENNFPVPFNNRVVKIIKEIEEGKLTIATSNVELFNDLF